ncbi:type I-C CRISPR-associated protein Cas7/Csd2 [Nocardia terpenica]|uniref:type I-C CRISPR-associated protein Cas7/Csd2 n=1 Tax=Nocardia terpenica TaxID=455432 RepID=UPI001893DCBD|nr:type I-C CRISPR-associated protein Cas7/Csd2 [Nocardia terpenica]MBF6062053.1 type I-C CRISPR-associated protein Cas7/Csd2 [Nocardia terpenica]MBF6106147.1 type I-C CRISPR-associated protein Cas7/Csd2 [Nocardia terpenica]MBF6110473.1 type I-C CRISPR-associated protein Cas7/Csd2 [Nocardia terpenica]MBF6120690.1 type I-C CRISPR-associated protein Cas7/Csd2 [Nocardia terpenica]MBF6151809.1 type I-C CRISPR-associated protein Cas7/Csd2 [Nocardia terpenica]
MTDALHLDPTRKHDFVFLFDVTDGNPNGDPDGGGIPRTDPETMQGLVTDVAIKRKIRNMVTMLGEGKPGNAIYVEAGVSLNSQHERAYKELGLPDDKTSERPAQRWMCENFYDVRMFGAVMSTGKKPAGRVQGPLQLTFSRSIHPVLPQEHGITRVTRTKEDDTKETEMGSKHAVHYGLYRGIGHFSAPLAARTGVTADDLATLWRAMSLMLEHDRSSTRGEMVLRGLYVFTHRDGFGTAPAHVLTDSVHITPDSRDTPATPIRSFADYTVTIDEAAIPDGVTLTRIVG